MRLSFKCSKKKGLFSGGLWDRNVLEAQSEGCLAQEDGTACAKGQKQDIATRPRTYMCTNPAEWRVD